MSVYKITLDDEVIVEQINNILNTVFMEQLHHRYTSTDREICAAVKELVYSHKDEIIGMVVDRAVKEIVKKGLPKLIERCENG